MLREGRGTGRKSWGGPEENARFPVLNAGLREPSAPLPNQPRFIGAALQGHVLGASTGTKDTASPFLRPSREF